MTLAERLDRGQVLHMAADVTHARRGALRHAFRYKVEYLLLSPETALGSGLFSVNRFNLFAIHDRDHGGPRGQGAGAAWAWTQLEQAGFQRMPGMVMALLTQPRLLGHWFTPVSFWLVLRGDQIMAAIAEVNNTFGQRHSYLCANPGFAPIGRNDIICTDKLFHVSPFQDVAGEYRFAFRLTPDHIAIRISQIDGDKGLDAAMSGALRPFTNATAIGACLRRPGGSLRVLALIYWNALRLKLKGAAYRPVPAPPDKDVS
ncbi:DUF1365 domain-containing protein [Paracoccus laeviglucosivorans]|uniref:Cyclopropane-fatty-acyl-phospholipid synthase n=1 Tax=Paracoccus laeviglucosivorans TaxID=1197861 RepID=A0A521FCT8_9RHOB|nr:DUF1365 domain-containing protein [Paracoccus laeviglucosivorans]SMO94008.1 hypothetical protein SAMN06265221_12059 [Paracoccus laeviglucosivorans]